MLPSRVAAFPGSSATAAGQYFDGKLRTAGCPPPNIRRHTAEPGFSTIAEPERPSDHAVGYHILETLEKVTACLVIIDFFARFR